MPEHPPNILSIIKENKTCFRNICMFVGGKYVPFRLKDNL